MKRSQIVATCLAVFILATDPLAAQDRDRKVGSLKRPEASVEPSPPAAGDQPAAETRAQLQHLFRQYPPTLPLVLRLDPSLLTNDAYLAMYPSLRSFVAEHPEIVHNPSFFISGVPSVQMFEPGDARGQTLRLMTEVLARLGIFLAFALVVGLSAWGLKTFIEHGRWLRMSKIQTDAHSKLLDRLTSNEDLLAYIQSPAGRQFLEGAPLPARPLAIAAPINRILWSVQAGVVLMLGGAGLLTARSFVGEEVGEVLSVLGVLNMFLGAGFVLSAVVAYALSKMLRLFASQTLQPHA